MAWVGLAQVFEQRPDDAAGHVDVERVQLVTRPTLPPAQRPHAVRQGIVENLPGLLKGAALGLRQLPQRLRRERFTVAHRGHAETHRRLNDRMARGLGLLVQGMKRRLPLRLFQLRDAAPLRLVFVGGEGPRHLDLERIHQIGHLPAKLGRGARRQTQRPRAVRLVEVVDVAPIGRRGAAVRDGAKSLEDHGGAASARKSHGEDVESGAADVQAELQRSLGALLADQRVRPLELGGGLEAQRVRIAGPTHRVGG